MRISPAIIGLCLAAIACGAAADPRAPCEALAVKARSLPATAWTAKLQALAPSLTLVDRTPKPTRLEKQIAAMPEVAKALYDEDGNYAVFVDQLPGAHVYLAYTVSGTLICQSPAFVKAEPGGRPRVIASPAELEGDLCWTSYARAASVFGEPALAVMDTFHSPEPAEDDVQITPWSGSRWAPSCRLKLAYRTREHLSEQFCADAGACGAIAPLAAAIAEAYRRPRKKGESFRFDPTPADEDAIQAVRGDSSPPELPTFGAKARTDYTTFAGVDYFPLTAGGERYVAAIGYGGFGWREIGDALLAVYDVRGGVARPVAGFVITRSIVGLDTASVEPAVSVGG